MHILQGGRAVGLGVALAVALSLTSALAAPASQDPPPDGGSTSPSADDIAMASPQPALTSCAPMADQASDLGVGSGPLLMIVGVPVGVPGTLGSMDQPQGLGTVIGVNASAANDLGAVQGPGTAGTNPVAQGEPIPVTCANNSNNQFTGGTE